MLFSDIDEKAEPIIKEYDHYFIFVRTILVPVLEYTMSLSKSFLLKRQQRIWLYGYSIDKKEAKLPIVKIELAETKSYGNI